VLAGGAEQIDDLGIAVERQRVLLLGPVERQGRDLAGDGKADVAGAVVRERQQRGGNGGHGALAAATARRAEVLVLASSAMSGSTSFAPRSAKISAIHPSCVRAMVRNARRPSRVKLTSWARRSVGDGLRSSRP